MKASLGIEAIGHDSYSIFRDAHRMIKMLNSTRHANQTVGELGEMKRWGVWDITYYEPVEVMGRKDYSRANSSGSRGIMIYYELKSGHRYKVRSPISWKRVDEYTCTVDEDGNIIKE